MLMNAAMYTSYGAPDVLRIAEVPRPEPRPDEVRVRVHATTATAACGMMRRGDTLVARMVLGLFRPRRRFRILGIELAGVVDAVGAQVSRFEPGDRVFGFTGMRAGAYADYICLPQSASIAHAPAGLSHVEAVTLVDGPTTALYFLRDRARLQAGSRLVIVGASGSIGSAAVQIARHLGAHVTAVCSGANAEFVRGLGANEVVDYTRHDYSSGGRRCDVVFDTVGKSTFTQASRCLVDGGTYLVTAGGLRLMVLDRWTRWFSRTRLSFGFSVEKRDALREVATLYETGVLRPVIDRQYPLAAIADAHRYVETGRKRGNVVITHHHPATPTTR